MKRFIYLSMLVLFVMATDAYARMDATSRQAISDIQRGVNNRNQIRDLRVLDTATIGGNLAVSGTQSATLAARSVVGRAGATEGSTDAITAAADHAVLRRSGSDIGFGTVATDGITAAAVTYGKIQDVTGLSVVGRAADDAGVSAAVTGADGQVLRVSGTTLGFGDVDGGSLSGDIATARLTDALGHIPGGIDLTMTSVSATEATVKVTLKNVFDETLEASKAVRFWFTTTAAQSTPSLDGIDSFSVSQGNAIAAMDYNADGTNSVFIYETHTNGEINMTVTADAGPSTNRFVVLGPSGSWSALDVEFVD